MFAFAVVSPTGFMLLDLPDEDEIGQLDPNADQDGAAAVRFMNLSARMRMVLIYFFRF